MSQSDDDGPELRRAVIDTARGAAAEAMRRILIERARRKRTTRHGGSLQRVDLEALEIASPLPDDDLLALHDALDRLAVLDAPAAELIKLRFFAGLTTAQAGKVLGVSVSTAENDWSYARSWLRLEMAGSDRDRPEP